MAGVMSASKTENSICLECGFCCDGTLFGRAGVEPLTEAFLGRYDDTRIELIQTTGVHFKQPCSEYSVDRGCMIYNSRPGVCRKFRCNLLATQNSGEITEDQAISTISEMKACRRLLVDHLETLENSAGGSGLSLNDRFLEVHGEDVATKESVANFCVDNKRVFVAYMKFIRLLKKFSGV